MKKLFTLLVVLTFITLSIAQQKVKIVPATDDQGLPIVNALIEYVVKDTSDTGQQLHDVYKLERGKYYFYNQSPIFKNPIILEADAPGTTDETRPPKIILIKDDEGNAPYAHCITTFANLTIRNIAFSTTTPENEYSWANVINLVNHSTKLVMEGCIFELSGWGMIEATVQNSVIIADRCIVRMATVAGSGDEWCPFFFEISAGSVDTLIVRNSTFFNLQGTILNNEAQTAIKYFVFDHNTCVNIVKGFSGLQAHLNTQITNNIFYNVGTHGQLISDVADSEDNMVNGIIQADTLHNTSLMAEKDRKFVLKNNVYFWSQDVKDYFNDVKDSIVAVPWMDARTTAMFADKTTYNNFVAEVNVNSDPKFKKFGGTDLMVAQARNHRTNGAFGFWGWDTDDDANADESHWAVLEWPLSENFAYTNDNMIRAIDGFSNTQKYNIGSLQWYPDQLDHYYKNSITNIENDQISLPVAYELKQNYPNPFNPSTTIEVAVPVRSNVVIKVYNVLGQEVANLLNEVKDAGTVKVNFNASNLSSGVYFYKLEATPVESGSKTVQSKKMLLVK